MMNKYIAGAAIAVVALVSGCVSPTSPTAGPGPRALSAAEAAGYFVQVCDANRNNANAARATLASLPFVLNTTENRYYHEQRDLSFVIQTAAAGRSYCEMGWRSNQSFAANRAAVTGAVPGTDVSEVSGGQSIPFFRAVMIDRI